MPGPSPFKIDFTDPITVDRYLSERIEMDGDCWSWTGTQTGGGYGLIRAGNTGLAHRFSYQYHRAEIPEGLVLDHLCRNTLCVNPWHLEPVTQRENLRRGLGFSGVNVAKRRCPQGHPYSTENTYVQPNGGRKCRTCRADVARTVSERRKRERRAKRLSCTA